MFKLAISLALIFLCQQVLAQERFIVYLAEFSGNLNNAVVRCPATIITSRHVLTTAQCATPSNSSFQLAIEIRMIFPGLGSGSRTISAERAFIHPNYTAGNVYSNNVAVVLMGGVFNTETLPPRTLGSIPPSDPTCNLFGWGGAADYPENVPVRLHSPEICYTNQSQTYCSEHVPGMRACAAYEGSPLICNPQSVDGILLETGCLEESPGRFLQAYHSVSEFREWIEMVSSAKLTNQSSLLVSLSLLVIWLKNVVR